MVRSLRGAGSLVGFVLVAVLAQICRNWLLLHAVGVNASFVDAIAVLIAMVTLGQLPDRTERRRRRRGAHPRQRRRGHGRRRLRAADRHRHARGTVLRRLGGSDLLWSHARRPASRRTVPRARGPAAVSARQSITRDRAAPGAPPRVRRPRAGSASPCRRTARRPASSARTPVATPRRSRASAPHSSRAFAPRRTRRNEKLPATFAYPGRANAPKSEASISLPCGLARPRSARPPRTRSRSADPHRAGPTPPAPGAQRAARPPARSPRPPNPTVRARTRPAPSGRAAPRRPAARGSR